MAELEAFTRDLISRYLAGELDADQLNDLLPDGWDLDEANDPAATDLALLALGYLAGVHSGDRDETELQAALRQLISNTILVEYRPADDLLKQLAAQVAEVTRVSFAADTEPVKGFESSSSQHPRTKPRTTTVLLGRR